MSHEGIDNNMGEISLIPLVTRRAKQLDWSGDRTVPHGSRSYEGGEKDCKQNAYTLLIIRIPL